MSDAIPYLDEAKERYVREGDEDGITCSLLDRGLHALLVRHLPDAISLLSETVDRFHSIGRTILLGGGLSYLGTALCFVSRLDEAISIYAESLQAREKIGDMAHLSLTLLGFAAVAYRQRDGIRAAILCGAADSIQRDNEISLPILPPRSINGR